MVSRSTPASPSPAPSEVYDLLAIGYGPSSVAIAIALSEFNANAASPNSASPIQAPHYGALGGLQQACGYDRPRTQTQSPQEASSTPSAAPRRPIKAAFIEKHDGFKWHPGMMLEGSRMQISFLKDLATLRNPQSPYTFLSYLASFTPSRLLSFISIGTFTPTRREFSDYLQWCAVKAEGEIRQAGGTFGFGEEVVAVEALQPDEEGYKVLRVSSRKIANGEVIHRFTRNLIVSAGGSAKIPPQLKTREVFQSHRVLHTSTFLDDIDSTLAAALSPSRAASAGPIRLAVVGGGQSATECFLALRTKLSALLPLLKAQGLLKERPQIDLLIRRAALRPTDEGAFSNEVFDPAMSHAMFGLDNDKRKVVLDEAKSTNYSIVNPVTLAAVYDEMYAQKVEEDIAERNKDESALLLDPKLTILPYTTLLSATVTESSTIDLELRNTIKEETRNVVYDAIVCGTGYDRQAYRNILFPTSRVELDQDAANTVPLAKLFSDAEESMSMPTIPQLPLDVDLSASSFKRRLSDDFTSPSSTATRSASVASSVDYADSIRRHNETSSSTPLTSPSIASTPSSSLEREKRAAATASPDFVVGENYRLQVPSKTQTSVDFKPTIWLQGSCEKSHGISDSLLSVLAVRSGEVVSAFLREGWFDARSE
ncbi:uncharacterized protein JCM15063_006394 [Sporobolomyces koalae]|uniref:uncharacterized protein n=1 Tax=Sporobolomyces koalae TaxID=500713 RepID=UPI00317248E1